MINIKKLECVLGGERILNIARFEIKTPGLYVILGPSGCGKTTLLNIIAGLNNEYTGKVEIFNRSFRNASKAETSLFRSRFLSTYFQHSVFIEELTLRHNISLVALNHTVSLQKVVDVKVEKLAKRLKIEKILDQKVKTLSGGEKTRGAIARTLLKEVPLYIFDEPTAALDKENALLVMDLIKEYARTNIVILVTHDENLANVYADTIYKMEYGEFKSVKTIRTRAAKINNALPKLDYTKNSDYIAKGLLKAKKARHFFTGGAVNLGLVGLGLSFMLVNAINYKLVNTFKGEFTDETAYVEKKFSPTINVLKSVSTEDIAVNISAEETVGALYLNDFNSFFPHQNELSFEYLGIRHVLPSFHIGLLNESLFLNEINEQLYPFVTSLEIDEIGLVLPFDDFKLIQNVLRIPMRQTPSELGVYLQNNKFYVTLEVCNNNWDYFDEQMFRLRTVMLGREAQIIMGCPSYIPHLFEEKMMFPSSINLTKVEEYPWTLKRINYLFFNREFDFLWQSLNYPKYVFSTANNDYFSYIFDKTYLNNRILIFESPPHFNSVLATYTTLKNVDFFTFSNGLIFIPEMMMLGFAHNFFIATNASLLEASMWADINDQSTPNPHLELPDGILNFAIQYNGFSSFNYRQSSEELALDELIISRGLAEKLGLEEKVINEKLYVGALVSIKESSDGYIKEYETINLTIKNIIESDEVVIYHHPLWAYLLYKDVFGVFPFALEITGAIYPRLSPENIKNFQNMFNITYPYKAFSLLVDQTLNELERYTFLASVGAFLLAALITFMTVYLLVAETSDQFSGLFLMGYDEEAIHGVISKYILRFLGLIIVLAIAQLFFLSFVVELVLMKYLNTTFSYVFNLKPYLLVLAFASGLLLLLLSYFKLQNQKSDFLAFSKRDL
ncbi:MAG: Maltose/maltodextrin import ATP-binding protein MalK [Tenericutes bacterium ADurb.Bin024]|nr:MAG: Maltose/maltodextrin import ATP-binding protein MalK [Tenericutes bacterium ADurb.Bin024]